MEKITIKVLQCMVAVLLLCSCKEQPWVKPINGNEEPPLAVAQAHVVENYGGGAVIQYTLPPNSNALYVQAEYDVGDGRIFKQKASVYNDTIYVEGFIRAGTFDVKLTSVNRAETSSSPISIQVNPTEPPFTFAAQSLDVNADFGGVLVRASNPTRADLAVLVLQTDSLGDWQEIYTEYSASDEIVFNTRGMRNEETTVAFTVRDKYQNFSDTVYWTGTPVLEERIDKSRFREYRLPTDQVDAFGWVMPRLWDDNLGTGFHTPEHPPGGMPQWFTFDMGQTVSLSRFEIFQRMDIYVYSHGNPREFEIYGASETPTASGEWDEKWQFLGAYEVIKPSGQLPGLNSTEDLSVAQRGHGFDFPAGTPQVRYIRVKVLSSWAAGFFHAMELTLYGENEN